MVTTAKEGYHLHEMSLGSVPTYAQPLAPLPLPPHLMIWGGLICIGQFYLQKCRLQLFWRAVCKPNLQLEFKYASRSYSEKHSSSGQLAK